MACRSAPAAGAPEWIVTFADLMSLLLCFFILLISFSSQDKAQLQIVAGSMRDAFGTEPLQRRAGIIELPGTPKEAEMQNHERRESFSDASDESTEKLAAVDNAEAIKKDAIPSSAPTQAAAADMMRAALQANPEIIDIAQQITFEDTPEGLVVSIKDGSGASLFGAGAAESGERLSAVIETLAPLLIKADKTLSIAGHSAYREVADDIRGEKAFALSMERAMAVRALLARNGVDSRRFRTVEARGMQEPALRDDPAAAGNRRVAIRIDGLRGTDMLGAP
ncbi:MAG: flagellar motor protein MotB [Labrys sp. (in: a-proteobacteria)]